MSTLFGDDAATPDQALTDPEPLIETFRQGCKDPDRLGIGIEYERLPVFRSSGLAVPYAASGAGTASVEGFLSILAASHGWIPQREAGHIIALQRDGTRITLEPGAQVELSGRVHRDLHQACLELMAFVREIDEVALAQGIAFLPVGFHPLSDFDRIGWVPKRRYEIMAPALARRGHLAHAMMKGTAGCQINLDYTGEDDAMEMMRVATAISSVVTALCANSPLRSGQASGFLTLRGHIWLHTDPDRCGLLPFALREDARFEDYLDYALDVPMFFVVRDGTWVDMTDVTFRQFLKGGHRGVTPLRRDWDLHLTTLFPEVRIKSWIEVRGSDSGPPEIILGQAALWKGILYDSGARRRAWAITGNVPFEERLAFHRDMLRRGLEARLGGRPARDLALELIAIAAEALPAQEARRLESLREAARRTPAERLLAGWNEGWRSAPHRLVEALAPHPSSLPACS